MIAKKHRIGIGAVIMLLLVAAAFPGGITRSALAEDRAQLKKDVERLYKQTRGFQELFQKSIELIMPSVVSISTTRIVKQPQFDFRRDFGPDQFFPFPTPRGRTPGRRKRKTTGLGSGFVIAADGYIVTNHHVVADVKAEDIKVIFNDGKTYTAEKVMRDPNTEVAVVKIDAKGLLPLEWGDSKGLKAGAWVIAVGSPLGLGNTATTGIVSATSTKNRVVAEGERHDLTIIRGKDGKRSGYAIEDYIQTDAAINLGNSGGPLVTLTGKVVGLNTLIVSPTRASAGLGFAVPEKIARSVVEQLIKRGRVIRGHLGVRIISASDLNDEAAWQAFEMHNADEVRNAYRIRKNEEGVLVAEVLPGAPAEKAGIQVGDLIKAVGDTPTRDSDMLRGLIAALPPGKKVTVTLQRKGRKKTIKVSLGEQPATVTAATEVGEAHSLAKLGLTVQTLTAGVAEGLGYPASLKGVVVTEVTPGSPAERAGLQANDVILAVGRKSVTNVKEFQEAIGSIGRKGVALRVRRGDTTKFKSLIP